MYQVTRTQVVCIDTASEFEVLLFSRDDNGRECRVVTTERRFIFTDVDEAVNFAKDRKGEE